MNEVWNVLTYRDYDFEDGNRRIRGRTLHCFRESKDPEWHGYEYAKLSVSSDSPVYGFIPEAMTAYEFSFDRRGRVVSMVACNG